MHHYFEAITNTSGDSLVGYFARVIDPASQNTIVLSSDDNGTPIEVVSGVDNMAKTDAFGNLDFYVVPGTYHLDIYAPNATSFIMRVSNVAMNSGKGDPGPQGEAGTINAYGTLAALLASDGSLLAAQLVPQPGETAPAGNFSYINGAWIRQGAAGIAATALSSGVSVNVDTLLQTAVDVRKFGAKCDAVIDPTLMTLTSGTDDSDAVQAALNYCNANGASLLIPGMCRVTRSINIDRRVNTAAEELRIIGQGARAGFWVPEGVTLFGSTYPNINGDPQSEFVTFQNLVFKAPLNSTNTKVISGRFLRVKSMFCEYGGIRYMDSDTYAQEHTFFNCMARAWKGPWFKSIGAFAVGSVSSKYQFSVENSNVFEMGDATGNRGVLGCFFHGDKAESLGTFIKANLALGMSLSGGYSENADLLMDLRGVGVNQGVVVSGMLIEGTATGKADADHFQIEWGSTQAATSTSNRCIGRLHNNVGLAIGALVSSGDFATLARLKDPVRDNRLLPSGVVPRTELTPTPNATAATAAKLIVGVNRILPFTTYGDSVTAPNAAPDGAAIRMTIINPNAQALIINLRGTDTMDNFATQMEFPGNTRRTYLCDQTGKWERDTA